MHTLMLPIQDTFLIKYPGPCVLAKAIGIGHHPPGPAELDSAQHDHDEGDVVQNCVRLAALVHPQSVVDVERLLFLLYQGKLLGDVVAKWISSSIPSQVLSEVP